MSSKNVELTSILEPKSIVVQRHSAEAATALPSKIKHPDQKHCGPRNSPLAKILPSTIVTPPMASHRGLSENDPEEFSPNEDSAAFSTPSSFVPRRGIPHVYHDYSQDPENPDDHSRKKSGGVSQPFPEKLHEMLNDPGSDPSIVAWLPHGRAFIVKKPKEFTLQVMPKFFKQSKLTSFQRQLNLYGFRRLTHGTDSGAYYHELFLRGRPCLSQRMVRQKVKGTGHKLPADADTEPNFYAMAPVQVASQPPPSPTDESHVALSAPTNYIDDPLSPGLHGAAHLLRGISSGLPISAIFPTSTPFLGPPAINLVTNDKTGESSQTTVVQPRLEGAGIDAVKDEQQSPHFVQSLGMPLTKRRKSL